MKTFAVWILCGLVGSTALAGTTERQRAKAEITVAEHAFSAMAQEKGVLAAFEHFAAPDVAFVDTDPRRWRGLEAVRERMGGTPADLKLTWSPLFVDASEDGTLGYDYGRYEARRPGAEGKDVVRTGFFLTIWKRQPDGRWRYVTDNGAPDKP
jgi:ketosteroid isomerase-like protein